MKVKRIKWILALFPAIFIGVFEFARHQFLHVISMEWGNLLVAVATGILFLIYFHGIFSILENVYSKLRKEQEKRAVLQERDRIAHELHDSVSQALFFINVKVLEVSNALAEQRQPLAEVEELKEAIKFTDADIRKHIFALQKIPQENINLVAEIQKGLDDFEEQNNSKVKLTINGNVNTKLNHGTKKQLLRIFQELLFNIRKHAGAGQVHVSLIEDDQQFAMIISDNGKGFYMETLKTKPMSFGFKMLESDAYAIGAKLDIQSMLGKGTTVTVSLGLR